LATRRTHEIDEAGLSGQGNPEGRRVSEDLKRTNVSTDKDSNKGWRAAIEAYARAAGYEIIQTFYDAAVSGADPVGERDGFAVMPERLMSNGA
jgi:hypothetical protein